MDDQNQTNQILDPATTPVVPSVPEDITPIEPPVTTTTTTTSSFEPTTPVEVASTPPLVEPTPVVEAAPPAEVTPSVSWPVPGPTQAPTPQVDTTTTTTTSVATPVIEPVGVPTPEEVPLPIGKPKKKMLPIIGGIVALLLVVGVAGAAYYVSNQLSTRQAVAPNAPESEPLACTNGCADIVGDDKCSGKADYCGTDGNMWSCKAFGGYNSCENPPVPCTQTYWSKGAACGDGGGDSGGVSSDCVRNGSPACHKPAPSSNVCTESGFKFGCGMECCSNSGSICCCNGCFPASEGCDSHGGLNCAASLTCDATRRDAPASNQITFAKSGKVIPFMRNSYTGTLTLSKTGSADINIPFKTGNAVELASFMVTAGDTYTIKNKIATEANNSYGWIPNKGAVVCGPVKTPGDPLNSNHDATGKCGLDVDISAVKNLAMSKTDLTGITSGGVNGSIQCWADAELGDATQDYDYNDYTVVFGYEIPTVTVTEAPTLGACMEIKIYKKVSGVYGTVALTPAQLGSLKVGDVLKLTLVANVDNLLGRFQITIGNEAPVLIPAEVVSGVPKQHFFTDYTVSRAGAYKFEAQVTTKSTN